MKKLILILLASAAFGGIAQAQSAESISIGAAPGCVTGIACQAASIALNGAANVLGQGTTQGLTTTAPSWNAQLAGDAFARMRIGLDALDNPSLAMGSGSAGRDAFFQRSGAASFRFGAEDAAAPVAQTLGVQNVAAGTSNVAGQDFTLLSSAGTGTGISGNFVFRGAPHSTTGSTQNARATILTLSGDTLAATFAGGLTASAGIISGSDVQMASTGKFFWANRAIWSSPADGQATLSNNGASSSVTFTVGAVNLLTLNGGLTAPGTITFAGLGSDSGLMDATVCKVTATNVLAVGSGTLGICLGTSSIRFKHDVHFMTDGLAQVEALRPVNFYYNANAGDGGKRRQYGLIAEDVNKVLPGLVGKDSTNQPSSVDLLGMVPVLIKAVQEEQAEIVALKARVTKLECRAH